MPNPFQNEYEKSYYDKMAKMGVDKSPCPRETAERRYPPVAADKGNPAVEVREGRILPFDREHPERAVLEIYSPQKERAIPPRTAEFKKD